MKQNKVQSKAEILFHLHMLTNASTITQGVTDEKARQWKGMANGNPTSKKVSLPVFYLGERF